MKNIDLNFEFDENGQLPKDLFEKIQAVTKANSYTMMRDNSEHSWLSIENSEEKEFTSDARNLKFLPDTLTTANWKVGGNLSLPLMVKFQASVPGSKEKVQVRLFLKPAPKSIDLAIQLDKNGQLTENPILKMHELVKAPSYQMMGDDNKNAALIVQNFGQKLSSDVEGRFSFIPKVANRRQNLRVGMDPQAKFYVEWAKSAVSKDVPLTVTFVPSASAPMNIRLHLIPYSNQESSIALNSSPDIVEATISEMWDVNKYLNLNTAIEVQDPTGVDYISYYFSKEASDGTGFTAIEENVLVKWDWNYMKDFVETSPETIRLEKGIVQEIDMGPEDLENVGLGFTPSDHSKIKNHLLIPVDYLADNNVKLTVGVSNAKGTTYFDLQVKPEGIKFFASK